MISPNEQDQKRFLVVDDLPEMRSALRTQLGSLGYNNVAIADSVRMAMEHLEQQGPIDVILCDYYLGGSTDGQQFLEHLRSKKLLRRSTLFIMITAEKAYTSVVTAAESLPDDYLIKPFTADTLKLRLQHLMDKKARLAKVDQLQDKERWADVITECDTIIASGDRYKADAMRIRGQALLACGRHEEALGFYQKVIDIRPMPWARLGLARAQQAMNQFDECKTTLLTLIEEAPQLLAAYDLLSRVQVAQGEADAALQTLDKASSIAPDSLPRLRAIAKVAERQSDFDRVKTALHRVVKKTQHSPLRDTRDVAQLSSAYAETGEPDVALSLIDEARKQYKSDIRAPDLAAVEALAHHKAGRTEQAQAALAIALQADAASLTPETAVNLARACMATGKQDAGEAILKQVMQNNPNAVELQTHVSDVMSTYASPERASALLEECVSEVVALNNEAVRLARERQYNEAARMLSEAASRLPGNAQIVGNAAMALLTDVYNTGLDADKLRRAVQFQQRFQSLDPSSTKHKDIAELQRRIRTRYSSAS